ncbi:Uu.00g128600.m01.CDS01 [Anthostomella pinea]|uniref:Uu.00g128600.m01.CDS01 n=1 Tax=Anthostomella pinea TaxID=933095 RepID=A0AAI8VIY4_9PEZI|nr:Uu.00g128600.m01.CDS01 [Anthostomella pinea]
MSLKAFDLGGQLDVLAALARVDVDAEAAFQLPSTTIVPFAALPSCAAECGPLYDANGICVPPNVPDSDATSYAACFCDYDEVRPFLTGTAGVCDDACPYDPGDLSSIHVWVSSFCADEGAAAMSTSAPLMPTSGVATTTDASAGVLSTTGTVVSSMVNANTSVSSAAATPDTSVLGSQAAADGRGGRSLAGVVIGTMVGMLCS